VRVRCDVRSLVPAIRRLYSFGSRRATNGSGQTASVPGARCSKNTTFQWSNRAATRSRGQLVPCRRHASSLSDLEAALQSLYRSVLALAASPRAVARSREDLFPVVLHADDRSSLRFG
jgi:hypothetical protein